MRVWGLSPENEDGMNTTRWTQRICIGTGLALASVFAVPAVASAAANPGCYTGCTPPTVANNTVPPPSSGSPGSSGTSGTNQTAATAASVSNGSTSLPFTGADVGELAAIGAGAIVVGGMLARRRRRTA
jgi:hypothetical protein